MQIQKILKTIIVLMEKKLKFLTLPFIIKMFKASRGPSYLFELNLKSQQIIIQEINILIIFAVFSRSLLLKKISYYI